RRARRLWRERPGGRERAAAPPLGMAGGRAGTRLDGLDRRRVAVVGRGPTRPPGRPAEGHDHCRGYERVGGIPHAVPVRCGAHHAVGAAPRRGPTPRRRAGRLERKSHRIAARIEQLREGIDRAHECLVAFGNPKGWLALFWAVLLSAPSHANKLLAGYVALRTLGIPANFVDILLLQTFITFLLYFAPTPGSAGLAAFLSAAVLQIYVGPSQLPLYALIWRFHNSYPTVITASLLFWHL